ncbi:MAG: methylated-DNA--[protein]-cysteine S-methyltransferase [Pseudomonadota bacterium]
MSTTTDDYQRIAKAIEWIAEHRMQQPAVADMAAAIGISAAHFSRMFRRWAGITPQRYLASLTLSDARDALSENQSVEQAAWASGLSGPGRLHDLFVRIDAVSPGEYKRKGEGLTLRFGFAPTRFGDAMLVTSDRGIVALTLGGEKASRGSVLSSVEADWPGANLVKDPAVATRIEGLLGGEETEINVLLSGSGFQHKVWQALLDIAPGETLTYGELGERIDRPRAARAIGSAVGANRVALLIPCHRVLRAGGALGGYRWGTDTKRLLLAWEHCQRLRA